MVPVKKFRKGVTVRKNLVEYGCGRHDRLRCANIDLLRFLPMRTSNIQESGKDIADDRIADHVGILCPFAPESVIASVGEEGKEGLHIGFPGKSLQERL